jgi:hypothetical protein
MNSEGAQVISRFRSCAFPVALATLLFSLGWVGLAREQGGETLEYPFNPKDFPKGWKFVSAEPGSDIHATWHVVGKDQDPKEAELICSGKPDGYIRTEAAHENFELSLEWKFPTDSNGNSGILIHAADNDMLWPTSFQVQLHRPTAGSVFPHDGAKSENSLMEKDLSRPVNEWNQCAITCERGKIAVVMNGKKVGVVTGCMPHKGYIALQSEGSLVHFRKICIKPLK